MEISLIQLMYFNLALEMHYVKKKARELIVNLLYWYRWMETNLGSVNRKMDVLLRAV